MLSSSLSSSSSSSSSLGYSSESPASKLDVVLSTECDSYLKKTKLIDWAALGVNRPVPSAQPDVYKLIPTLKTKNGDHLFLMDTEGTSLSPYMAKPAELANQECIVEAKKDQVDGSPTLTKVDGEHMNSLIRRTKGSKFLENVGITKAALSTAPELQTVMQRFFSGMKRLQEQKQQHHDRTKTFVVGHNLCPYDIRMLDYQLKREGQRGFLEQLADNGVDGIIDTLGLFREFQKERARKATVKVKFTATLSDMYELSTGNELTTGHRAVDDVDALHAGMQGEFLDYVLSVNAASTLNDVRTWIISVEDRKRFSELRDSLDVRGIEGVSAKRPRFDSSGSSSSSRRSSSSGGSSRSSNSSSRRARS